jgi:hypothetical protein
MKGFQTKDITEGRGGHERRRITTVIKKRTHKEIETEWVLFIVPEIE